MDDAEDSGGLGKYKSTLMEKLSLRLKKFREIRRQRVTAFRYQDFHDGQSSVISERVSKDNLSNVQAEQFDQTRESSLNKIRRSFGPSFRRSRSEYHDLLYDDGNDEYDNDRALSKETW